MRTAIAHPALRQQPPCTARYGIAPAIALCLSGCPAPESNPYAQTAPDADPTASPAPPYGLETRESNASCMQVSLYGSPMKLTDAFPNLSFSQPVFLTHAGDGSNRLFVLEQDGIIRVFDNDPAVTESAIFLDLQDRVDTWDGGGEMGLLGLAFHPDFASNGYFYVDYTTLDPLQTIVSRFQIDAESPLQGDPESETVILRIDQPDINHNGGMLAFGPDGYLYIGLGDGGGQGDPNGYGQDTTDLLGDILRLDVDDPDDGAPYGIPADNPFAGDADGNRPEIYAWGFRNPWRFSFDRLTGELWAGDVGQDSYEEIDLVELGHNYGWNLLEGTACYAGCDSTGLTAPITTYSHDDGQSVTGGYVYYGSQLPTLYGAYLYGDYSSGSIWALRYDGTQVVEQQELVSADVGITSFGEDEAGEVYVVGYDYRGGKIFALTPAEPKASSGEFPATLSATGCFDDVRNRVPASGVIPYAINSPLWADGTQKSRWFALPDGKYMGFHKTDAWDLPEGTALFKDFALETVEGDPASARLLETRMLFLSNGYWFGYVYKWNEEQTDAELLEGSLTETYTVTRDGAPVEVSHYYPSSSDCGRCHTPAAGYALGFKTGQMNRDFDYDGVIDNQIRSYVNIGLFGSSLIHDDDNFAAYPDPGDEAAPLEARARSYLDANCAQCHRPGGPTSTTLDLRYETALPETNTCGVAPLEGDLGISGALIVAPGAPELSILSARMHATDDDRMPPLASLVVDPLGTSVIDAWIDSLSECPVSTTDSKGTDTREPRE